MWPACSDEGGLEGLVEEEALMGGALPSAAAEVVGGVGDGEEGVDHSQAAGGPMPPREEKTTARKARLSSVHSRGEGAFSPSRMLGR